MNKEEAKRFWDKWSDKKQCLEAVKESGYALAYVKEQDKDICLEAVKSDGYALKFVRDKNLFFELVDIINKK